MAYQAALKAIEDAQVDKNEIDLIIVGTFTPDTSTPSTACRLQDQLGIKAAAMDLSAACAGFLYSLVTASQFIAAGTSYRVLVVGADLLSRIINPEDKKIFPLFGDGAGAVVLGPGTKDQGLVSYTLGSEGEGGDLLCVPGGGSREPLTIDSLEQQHQFLHMDGRSVFKWAVRLIADSVNDVLHHADITAEEVSLLFLHQANVRIIDAACESLGFDRNKVPVNLDLYGNTSAGSVPLILDEIRQQQPINSGDSIILSGFGAGLTWGTALFRW